MFKKIAGIATGIGIAFAGAANAHEMRSMMCTHIDSPSYAHTMGVINQFYVSTQSMTNGSSSFSVRQRKDSTDQATVVTEFGNGQVCFAPVPSELEP